MKQAIKMWHVYYAQTGQFQGAVRAASATSACNKLMRKATDEHWEQVTTQKWIQPNELYRCVSEDGEEVFTATVEHG